MHWRNGAIAIPYMTTVLLQLADREVLRLDDKLAKWFPHYPKADRITLAMLANNTSGYADYVNLDLLPILDNPYRQWTPAELIATGLAQPMVCEPGTCFAYAHTNYVILGQVLSLAAGKPLATLIREGVLAPLRLNDTRSEDTPFIAPPVLHAFTSERGRYEESTDWNPSWTLAEGAIMTTDVPDVLRSAVAIGKGELVSAAAFAQFLDPSTAKFPGLSGSFYYGLGVIVTSGWITQTPSFFGYSGVMAYLPEYGIAVALTSTMGPTTPDNNVTLRLFQRIATRLAPSHRPTLAGI